MKRAPIAVMLVLATMLAGTFIVSPIGAEQPKMAGSVVKVDLGKGHGSAVHIGNGYFLTAQHVVTTLKSVTLKSDMGETIEAEVMWASATYDVALLRADWAVASSPLACGVIAPGEAVYAIGSPMELEFVTYWGRVAGPVRQWWRYPQALPIDVTVGPGMSGGPLFDAKGNVVGIIVAGYKGMPINVAVPSRTICDLLGRA